MEGLRRYLSSNPATPFQWINGISLYFVRMEFLGSNSAIWRVGVPHLKDHIPVVCKPPCFHSNCLPGVPRNDKRIVKYLHCADILCPYIPGMI